MLADLFEGPRLAAVETEAELEDLALALVERGEQAGDLLGQQRGGRDLEGRVGATILDDVAELGVAVLTERLGERERLGCEAKRLGDLLLGHLDLDGQLGQRGGTAVLELQTGASLLESSEGVAGVHREPDRPAGVGDATGDRLTDPPGGVGGELEALAPVELLDGVHQAKVALLDQVEERQARRLILLGDRDDESEVGLHEGALGLLALLHRPAKLTLLGRGQLGVDRFELRSRFRARFDGLGEADLVLLREQGVLADIGQVQANEVFFIPFDTFLRHRGPPAISD